MNSNHKIMITGASGFIASWITLMLLQKGYTVHATVRDLSKDQTQLKKIAADSPGEILFFEADLLKPNSFLPAMSGCKTVVHVASPCISNTNDPFKDIINPAVTGTTNVLESVNATESITRVILTSSFGAILGDYKDLESYPDNIATEAGWNYTSSTQHQPYNYSKYLSEKSAWEIHDNQSRWSLAVMNPVIALGPPLLGSKPNSIKVIEKLIRGKMLFGAPDCDLALVDVRDVAQAHVNAITNPKINGRYIIATTSLTTYELADKIKTTGLNIKMLPRYTTPKIISRLLEPIIGNSRLTIDNNYGYKCCFNNYRSRHELGIEYRSIDNTILDCCKYLLNN